MGKKRKVAEENRKRSGPGYAWLNAERGRERRDNFLFDQLSGCLNSFKNDYRLRQEQLDEWRFREFMRLLEKAVDKSPVLFREMVRLGTTDPILTGHDNLCVICPQDLPRSREEWPYSVLKHCYTKRHESNVDRVIVDGRIGQLFVYRQSIRDQRDIGPTSACWQCGNVVPVAEMYVSTQTEYKALCPTCFKLAEAAGRARKKGENIRSRGLPNPDARSPAH